MSHEEVRLLLNGWLENNAQLGVVGQLWGFGFALLRSAEAGSCGRARFATPPPIQLAVATSMRPSSTS